MSREQRIFIGAVAVAAVAAVVVVLVTGGKDDSAVPSAAVGSCETTTATNPRTPGLDKPPSTPSADRLTATIATSEGDFTVELDTAQSPKTVASFEYLATNGVYDCTPFHRVIRGYVIQGGDPAGDGTGGPGYSITETPPADAEYTRGVVAMAKTAVEPPGTSGSQFFVVVAADAGLPPDYAILGTVSGGTDVVRKIEALGDPTGVSEAPTRPVAIETVTVEPG